MYLDLGQIFEDPVFSSEDFFLLTKGNHMSIWGHKIKFAFG